MVGPALFALVTVALTVAQYDFMIERGWRPLEDPAGSWPSGLALGPYGWAQSLSFAVSGLLLAVFALRLHHGMAGSSKAGPSITVWACASLPLVFQAATLLETPAGD